MTITNGVSVILICSLIACCPKFIVYWWGRCCYLTLNMDVPFMDMLQVLWTVGITLNKCKMPSTYTLKKFYQSLYELFCTLGGGEERRREEWNEFHSLILFCEVWKILWSCWWFCCCWVWIGFISSNFKGDLFHGSLVIVMRERVCVS